MELQHLSYLGWLALGISSGAGPCVVHNTLVLVPYVGTASEDARGALREVLSYSAARVLAYSLLGGLAGLAGGALHDLLAAPAAGTAPALVFGLLLIGIALASLFYRDSSTCRWLHGLLIRRQGRAMFLAGVVTALMPCPILLAVITVATASGSPLYGTLAAGSFALGTAAAPPLLIGPLLGLLKSRTSAQRLGRGISFLGALFLFGYGLHLLLGVLT